jgi:hypothetical protein
MSRQDGRKGVDRRGFLRTLGAGAGAGVTAAAVGVGAAPAPAEAAESAAERKKARYQANSAHVQAYYRTNRY